VSKYSGFDIHHPQQKKTGALAFFYVFYTNHTSLDAENDAKALAAAAHARTRAADAFPRTLGAIFDTAKQMVCAKRQRAAGQRSRGGGQ
jgi:hypothetical protein